MSILQVLVLGHGHHAPGLVSPLPPLACDNSTEPKRAGGQGSRAAATWTRTLEVGAENLEAKTKKDGEIGRHRIHTRNPEDSSAVAALPALVDGRGDFV